MPERWLFSGYARAFLFVDFCRTTVSTAKPRHEITRLEAKLHPRVIGITCIT